MQFRNGHRLFGKNGSLEMPKKGLDEEAIKKESGSIVVESMGNDEGTFCRNMNESDDYSIPTKLDESSDFNKLEEIFIFQSSVGIIPIVTSVISFALLIVLAYFLVIAMAAIYCSTVHEEYVVLSIPVILFGVILNVRMIRNMIKELRFSKRYAIYYEILREKMMGTVDELAQMAGADQGTVLEDLKKSVDYKLVPQGHFDDSGNLFMISDFTCNEAVKW